jgi:hypothetical protein
VEIIEPTKPDLPLPEQHIPSPLQELCKDEREQARRLARHRTSFLGVPEPDNVNFISADPHYTKLYHGLAIQYFSKENVKKYAHSMNERL